MTPDQLLDRLAAVRIDRSHGGRAPHKPLMLLLALARVGLGPESRLIPYETADERFKELWEDFGRPGAPPRVHYPFGRLRNDDRLWEIPEESLLSTGRAADIRVSEARRLGITGGFRREVHDLLWRRPERELTAGQGGGFRILVSGRRVGEVRLRGGGRGFGRVRPPVITADVLDRRTVERHRERVSGDVKYP